MNKDKFKLFIKEARLKAKLTQQELALILNVDVTAVSKWERGVSYPDITLLQDICNVLEISEKELLGSKKDDEYRQVKHDANKFNKIKDTIFFVSTICYLVAIISCFIINIATKQTLSWFFVVLASCICGFTFIPTCLRFFNKNKLLIYVTSTYLGLLILFFTISIYTQNYWCFIASIGTLLFYILVFYPILFHKYFNHFKKYFLLTYSLLLCLFTVILLLITNTYIHIELIKGLKITSYCFSFLIAYGIVNIFKINKNIKASIDSFIMAPYFFFLYVVLEKNIENRQSFYDVITNATNYDKITLIIGISICIILAILL